MPVSADSTTNADSDEMCNPQVYVLLFCYYYWGWGVRMWCNGLIQSSAIAAHDECSNTYSIDPLLRHPLFFFPSNFCLFAALPLCRFASLPLMVDWLFRSPHIRYVGGFIVALIVNSITLMMLVYVVYMVATGRGAVLKGEDTPLIVNDKHYQSLR